jgi:hypothetical protein
MRKTSLPREREKEREPLRRQAKYLPIHLPRTRPAQTLARLDYLSPSLYLRICLCRKQHSPPPPGQWLSAFGVRRRRAWNHTTTVLTRHDGPRSTLRQWDDAVGARRWLLRPWETTL